MIRSTSPKVSAREAEVLALLGERLSNAQIAHRLHLSVRTVENHVSSLLRKYAVADRTALSALATTSGGAASDQPPGGIAGLPEARTPFIGRGHERDAVLAMLERSRLVTLVGPGGVGKTRLAGVVAQAAAPSFPVGGAFVDLAPVTGTQVVRAVAAALAITERAHAPLAAAVTERLGTNRWLLVLDNCEHLLDPVAEFADRILSACPAIRVLATSRERLGLPGEQVVPISPLPLASDAEALFVDRARAADPGFAAAPAVVAGVCARLDGMPLAIELAAARAAALGAEGLHDALDDALGPLSLLTDRRTRPERAAPVAAGGDRMEPPVAGRRRAGAVPAPVRVQRRLRRPGRARGGESGGRGGHRSGGRPARPAGR
jgi:DNA-binding CsgD family transcriptional regulator